MISRDSHPLKSIFQRGRFLSKCLADFFYKPTSEQEITIESFINFLFSPKSDTIFLLKGYAGTGKTALISALVKTLDQLKQKCVLLAPTGRAAKVFSHYAGHSAYTVHRKIYRQRSFSNELDNFVKFQSASAYFVYCR